MKRFGHDPHRLQPGSFRGEQLFEGTVVDYFRVEPLSSVLTFWIATGALVAALASLTLALVALFS
jgi:hypothetical protein